MEEKSMKNINLVRDIVSRIKSELQKRIVGNDENIDLILTTLFADGHVLLEGVPGIAKSYIASSLGEVLGLDFKRIQFVPDLLPADILGSSIYNPEKQEFVFIEGPIFASIILCDEINRAPPKTQAALLEAMQERQASVEGKTYQLPKPLFVIATQNPIEQIGVYRLPEAQVDRFMIKLNMSLPGYNDEVQLLYSKRNKLVPEINEVTNTEEILEIKRIIETVEISDVVLDYIARLIVQTRFVPALSLGASPRASISLMMMGRARAAMLGRNYVEPDDIKQLLFHVINHRLILTPQAEIEQIPVTQIIENVIENTPVSI